MAFKLLILILFLLIIGMIFYSLNKIREGAGEGAGEGAAVAQDESPKSYKDTKLIASLIDTDTIEQEDENGVYIALKNNEGNEFWFDKIDLSQYPKIKQSSTKQIFANNCVKYGPDNIGTIVVQGEPNAYKAYYIEKDFNPPIDPKLKELIPNLDSVKKKEIVYKKDLDLDKLLSVFNKENQDKKDQADKYICTIYLNEDCELIFNYPVIISYLVVGAGGNGGNVNNSIKIGGGGGGGGQIRVGNHSIEINTQMKISVNDKNSKISTKGFVKVALKGFDGNIGFGGKAGGGIKESEDEDDGPYKNSNSMPSSVTGGGSGGESVNEIITDYNGTICLDNCALYKNNLNGGDGSIGYKWIDGNVYGAGGGGGAGKGITPDNVIVRGYGGNGCRISNEKDVVDDSRIKKAEENITNLRYQKEDKQGEVKSETELLQNKYANEKDTAEKDYTDLSRIKKLRNLYYLRPFLDDSDEYDSPSTDNNIAYFSSTNDGKYSNITNWVKIKRDDLKNIERYRNKMNKMEKEANLRTLFIYFLLDTLHKDEVDVFDSNLDMDMYLLKYKDFDKTYNIDTYENNRKEKRIAYNDQQLKIYRLTQDIKDLDYKIKVQNDDILRYQARIMSNRGNGGSTIYNSSDKLNKYSNSEEYGNENFLNGGDVVVNGLTNGYFGCGGGGGASVFGYKTPDKSIGGKGSPGIVAIRIYSSINADLESPSIKTETVNVEYVKDEIFEYPCNIDYYNLNSRILFKCNAPNYLCNNSDCPGDYICSDGKCYPPSKVPASPEAAPIALPTYIPIYIPETTTPPPPPAKKDTESAFGRFLRTGKIS